MLISASISRTSSTTWQKRPPPNVTMEYVPVSVEIGSTAGGLCPARWSMNLLPTSFKHAFPDQREGRVLIELAHPSSGIRQCHLLGQRHRDATGTCNSQSGGPGMKIAEIALHGALGVS